MRGLTWREGERAFKTGAEAGGVTVTPDYDPGKARALAGHGYRGVGAKLADPVQPTPNVVTVELTEHEARLVVGLLKATEFDRNATTLRGTNDRRSQLVIDVVAMNQVRLRLVDQQPDLSNGFARMDQLQCSAKVCAATCSRTIAIALVLDKGIGIRAG